MQNKIDSSTAVQIIKAIEEVCGHGINFIAPDGTIFSSSDEKRVGDFHEIGYKAAQSGEIIEVADDNEYDGTKKGVNIPILYRNEVIAVIGISGEPDEVRKYTKLAARIALLIIREQEIEERDRAQKQKYSYVMQSLINGQITNRNYFEACLEELKIGHDRKFRIVLLRLDKRYNVMNISLLEEHIERLFASSEIRVFSYIYPNEYAALYEEQTKSAFMLSLRQFAKEYKDFLTVGVGDIQPIDRTSASYDNAQTAIRSIQREDNGLCEFDKLDIEILLAKLPEGNKSAYLAKTLSKLTDEEKEILRVYFEEDMSLQRSCERLFVHKNTMQYRLERIWNKTGYNPRKFRNAVILYLGLKLDKK